jgi:hypothetical protein
MAAVVIVIVAGVLTWIGVMCIMAFGMAAMDWLGDRLWRREYERTRRRGKQL